MDIETLWDERRAAARGVGWALIAGALARVYHIPLLAALFCAGVNLAFLWFVSFGVFEFALIWTVGSGVRLVFAADAAAYALCASLVRIFAGDIPPAARFPAAFIMEVLLVFSAGRLWSAARLTARLGFILARAVQ